MPKTNGCLVKLVDEIVGCGCPDCARVLGIIGAIIDFCEKRPAFVKHIAWLLGMHTTGSRKND